ncbi:MAG TPA: serine/threonine-protein kinase, partial [Longimicrobium sp.]|nr:serine/threonine-protein kinase [Longimicrobium sp.]
MADAGGLGGVTPERWRRINDTLDEALDLAPDQRDGFLARACGDDAALRTEVEQLLRSCESTGGLLDAPAPGLAAALADGEPGVSEGTLVGPYRIVRELASGGMGTVYLAERDDPRLRQRVALKMVRQGLHADYLVRRFLEERQILASLEHPGIARLLDGAVTAAGVPWFAMEYVEGVPLDEYCDRHRLGVDERLRLFAQVCDAVQYAHRNLVAHRDLKPSNILVTESGQPKLLDFGIARLVAGGEAPADGERTAIGPRLLTPEYASPEQLRGEPVSTVTDVYSLGVILYGLLTGRRPYRPRGESRWELPGALLGPPERPSALAAAGEEAGEAAASRGTTPARLARRLMGDLDAIVLKAMRPEPGQRYATAEQLAADLRRHAAGLPVGARADTRWYRVRKFVSRHRAGVAASAAALVLLMGFAVVTRVQAMRIAAERDRAQQVESFLLGLFDRSDLYQGSTRAVTVRDLLDRGAAEIADVRQPEVRWRLQLALGHAYYGQGDYGRAIALLDSSYAALRRLRGERDQETIAIANQLANVLRVAGRYDRAQALYRVILDARRRELGAGSVEVARSLNGLAMVLRMQGRYTEAEGLLREALAIDRMHAADAPSGLPQTLNNLGHVMRESGRLGDAEALHRESLAVRRAVWGPEHFEVTVSLANLAGVLRDRGDHSGADTLYRQVLALRLRLAGEEHPDLAMDRAGYAQLLHLRGDLEGGEALYRRALTVQRQVLPPGHALTATTLTGLGALLVDRDRPAEALPLLQEALAARRGALPPGHWYVAETESALGA